MGPQSKKKYQLIRAHSNMCEMKHHEQACLENLTDPQFQLFIKKERF